MQESFQQSPPDLEPDPDQFLEEIRQRRKEAQEQPQKNEQERERRGEIKTSQTRRELLNLKIKANSPEAERLQQALVDTSKELTSNFWPLWQSGKYEVGKNYSWQESGFSFRFVGNQEIEMPIHREADNPEEPVAVRIESKNEKPFGFEITLDLETGFLQNAARIRNGEKELFNCEGADVFFQNSPKDYEPLQTLLKKMIEWDKALKQ